MAGLKMYTDKQQPINLLQAPTAAPITNSKQQTALKDTNHTINNTITCKI